MEVTTEVQLPIDFSKYGEDEKKALIYAINEGNTWTFEGEVDVDIEPDDIRDESRD